ncbi:MAG: MoaA/NifB/PqqE/SkfB family radical SAM enzyme/SAM-dependent methyltransferase [Myxococcota bacterium]
MVIDTVRGEMSTTRAFDRHAEVYRAVWGDDPSAQAMRRAVWSAADVVLPAGGRILDAGCGIGLDSEWLVESGRQVVAIDASAGMVAQTRARLPDVAVHHLPIQRLGGLSETFDGAISDFGVINCLDPTEAAAALADCLRPGAPVVVVPMPRLNPAWMLYRLLAGHPRDALSRLRRRVDVDVEGEAVSTRYLTLDELTAAFAPWFDLEHSEGLGVLMPPPGSGVSAAIADRMERLERPLRRLPLLRGIGDHLIVVFRRRGTHRPGGPLRRRRATGHARRTGQVRALRVLVLEVTQGCQSQCVSCDFRGPAGGEALTPARCGVLTEQAVSMGCTEVILTGGEPLLRPDIAAIFQHIRLAGAPICLLTNGLALARHAALVARWCRSVVVSLDGHTAEQYRRIRGVDGLGAVSAGVAALRVLAPGMPITARVTVTAQNAGSLTDIGLLAVEMGLSGVSYLAADTQSADAFGRTDAAALPGVDTAALRTELSNLRAALPAGFLTDSPAAIDRIWQKYAADAGQRSHAPPRCDAPYTSTVVGADLSIRPCFFLPPAASAADGLRSGLTAMAPRLAELDIEDHPTCARCVCWARLT